MGPWEGTESMWTGHSTRLRIQYKTPAKVIKYVLGTYKYNGATSTHLVRNE
jgi:hypothetical protein